MKKYMSITLDVGEYENNELDDIIDKMYTLYRDVEFHHEGNKLIFSYSLPTMEDIQSACLAKEGKPITCNYEYIDGTDRSYVICLT